MSQFADVAAKEVLAGLRAALDPDSERAARKYVLLRRKLVSFFEWNGVTSPDACADETLTGVAWRLTDGAPPQTVTAYCVSIARSVLIKQQTAVAETPSVSEAPAGPDTPAVSDVPEVSEASAVSEAPQTPDAAAIAAALASLSGAVAPAPIETPAAPDVPLPSAEPDRYIDLEKLLHAFETGLDALPEDSRDLILTYYAGERHQGIEARLALARRLRLPISQLRFHAHRTRSTLEQSVMGGEAR